jgi:hypothetical protein
MSTDSYLNGRGYNTFSENKDSNEIFIYGSSPFIGRNLLYSGYSIKKFLQLKKDVASSNVSTGSKASNNIGADQLTTMTGDIGEAFLEEVNQEVAKKYVQMFYNAYMAPIGSDITYRLGSVTGIKTQSIHSPDAGKIYKDYDTDNIITDEYGRIYTRSNFATRFSVTYHDCSNNKDKKYTVPYVNLFFPPYKYGLTVYKTARWDDALDSWKKSLQYTTAEASTITYDLMSFKNSRGNFTYREPAFKSINDNITLLQFIMEQVTGVVSTYLPEWDLSLYLQEGLVNSIDTGLPPVVCLTNRIYDDNPLSNMKYVGYYGDDRALAFGAVNAAVSKLYGDNKKQWVPNYYPLSAYWTPYWFYDDVYTSDGSLKLSINELSSRNIAVAATDGTTTSLIPSYYYPNLGNIYHNYYDISDDLTFKDKVRLVDERYAALSGWTSWDGLNYYRLFYTTNADALSDTDTTMQNIDKSSRSLDSALKTIRKQVVNNGGLYSNEGLAALASASSIPKYTTSGEKTVALGNSSGSSSGNPISKFAKYMLTGDKGDDSSSSSQIESDEQTSGTSEEQCMSIASKGANGYADAATALDPYMNSSGAKNVKTKAPTVGIPQHNPPIFGGPHGDNFSPKTPQSFFEENNIFLRNIPRIDKEMHNGFTDPLSSDYASSVEKYYTKNNEKVINTGDLTPSASMAYLLDGMSYYTIEYTYSYENIWMWFPGEFRYTYRRCSSYVWFPSTWEGRIIDYVSGVSWGWYSHYAPFSGYSWSWYEGAYWSYANENAYTTLQWRGNYYVWYIRTYAPHMYGHVTVVHRRPYKRYQLHSEPTMFWRMTQVKLKSWQVEPNGVTGFWSWLSRTGLPSWFTGLTPMYAAYSSGFDTVYKVDCGGYTSWTKSIPIGKGGWTWVSRSSGDDILQQKMIGNNRSWGSSTYLIFCEGGDGTRWQNGPESIFRCRVKLDSYPVTYYEEHSRKHCGSCRHHCWRGPKVTNVQYVRAYPQEHNSTTFYKPDCNKPAYSNIGTNQKDFLSFDIPSNYQRTDYNLMSKFRYGGGGTSTVYDGYRNFGIHGWGILSNIPSLNYSYENSWFENFSSKMNISSYYSAWANTRFIDLPLKLWAMSDYRADYRVDEYGSRQYMPGGFPSYHEVGMDYGLKKALINSVTRATFYKSSNPYISYFVGLDNGFRLLLEQIYWQLSFLETSKDLFVNQVDYNTVKILIKDYTDESVQTVSSDGYDSTLKVPYSHETAYNYWFKKAKDAFLYTDSSSFKSHAVDLFNTRMSNLRSAVPALKTLANKESMYWTWNEMTAGWQTLDSLYRTLYGNSSMEEYMMYYLSVLYEYRKYFINMRFNKRNGTMWTLRELETQIPTVISNAMQTKMPSFQALAKSNGSEHTYNVAFYDVTNSVRSKVSTLASSNTTILDEDRIKTVYIKVEYVDEDKYTEYTNAVKNNESYDDIIVKIKENGKYAIQPPDDIYYIDSLEREKNNVAKSFNAALRKDKEPELYYTVTFDDNVQYSGFASDVLTDRETNTSYKYSAIQKGQKIVVETTVITTKSGVTSYVGATITNIETKSITPTRTSESYKTESDIDDAEWYIHWGNEKQKTPIFFGVTTSISAEKIAELMKSAGMSESSALTKLCASRSESDYWTIHLPREVYPRKSGYNKQVTIKTAIKTTGSLNNASGDAETTVNGALAYTLWPITEEQSEYSMNDQLDSTAQNKIINSLGVPLASNLTSES